MGKVFEALETLISKTGCMNDTCANLNECLKSNFCKYNTDDLPIYPMCPDYEMAKTLKNALTELKAIKEAKPSEALELVYLIKDYFSNMIPYSDWINNIEKYILKAQEQEKVLEIIKEKDVDIYILKSCKTVDEYNSSIVHIVGETRELTEEEFDLLKRYLNGK